MNATATHHRGRERLGGAGHFALHFVEMCVPMCIGFAVGDAIYFALSGAVAYSEPFRQLPVLSLAVVTVCMTAPMVAWMRFRGMAARPIAEMAAGMGVLAVLLLAVGGAGVVAMSTLPLLAHGLMMPAMLVPMLFRLDLYAA